MTQSQLSTSVSEVHTPPVSNVENNKNDIEPKHDTGLYIDGDKVLVKDEDGIVIRFVSTEPQACIRVITIITEIGSDNYGWLIDSDVDKTCSLQYNQELHKYEISRLSNIYGTSDSYHEITHHSRSLIGHDVQLEDIRSILNINSSEKIVRVLPYLEINIGGLIKGDGDELEEQQEEELFQTLITQLQLCFILYEHFRYPHFKSIWSEVVSQMGHIEIYQYMVHRNYTLKILEILTWQIKAGTKFDHSTIAILDSKFTRDSWSRQPSCCGRMKLNGLIFDRYYTFKSFLK